MPFKFPFQRRRKRTELEPAELIETPDGRGLLLGTDTLQSLMDPDDPIALKLSYTRAMMAALLFQPNPQRVLHLGLGGGSMLRFVLHHYPEAFNLVIELHPDVIELARDYFLIPPNHDTLHIQQGDGVAFMAQCEQQFDLILVDAFDGHHMVTEMGREPFIHECWQALAPHGVAAFNFWRSDPHFERRCQAVERVFQGWAFRLPATARGNIAMLALKQPRPDHLRFDRLKKYAQKFAHYQIEFDTFIHRLRAENPHTPQRLHARTVPNPIK